MVEVTKEWLEKNRTKNGGWNNCQLALLGENWPPKAGWMDRILGRRITKECAAEFERLGHTKPTRADRRKYRNAAKVGSPKLSIKPYKPKMYGLNVTGADFLSTYEWRRVRMEALKRYGPRCQCCGATPADGAVMNVDHIKPRKLYPHLALDLDNLQVLCDQCNHGKGNWDMTDWRASGQDPDEQASIRFLKLLD